MDCVSVEFSDLLTNGIDSQQINQAFGPNGLGIIIIRHVIGLPQARNDLFDQGRKFSKLDPQIQKNYESPDSNYSFGWSRGKEMMSKGQVDTMKGSYYANPLNDNLAQGDMTLIKKYPGYFTPNIWPTDVLPNFETNFKTLGSLIYQVALRVLKECDKLLPKKFIKEMFDSNLISTKGRLLHYYYQETKSDSWCGWHLDHGFFTGLVAAQYYDTDTGLAVDKPSHGGLKIRSPSGELVSITIPEDAIAFQIGETAQILSGGYLRATPHYVQKPNLEQSMDRVTLALFIDCPHDTPMVIPDYALDDTLKTYYLPEGKPLLKDRLKNTTNYLEFGEACYKAYLKN